MNSFFINSIEALEESVEDLQTGEFFRGIQSRKFLKERHVQHSVEREAGKACAILMHEQTTISQLQLARAISKITEFVDCMDGLFSLDDDSLLLDTSDEECISVKFKRDRNMSLDIYFFDVIGVGEVNHGGVLQIELDDVADLQIAAGVH